MKLRLEPVTAANRAQALALSVQPAQAGFVETVEECLAQADAERGWHPVLLYDCAAAGGAAADTAEAGAVGAGAAGSTTGAIEVGAGIANGCAASGCVASAPISAEAVGGCAASAPTAAGAAGSAPVGFAMYKYFGLFPPLGQAWLDRLLIDAHVQGRGYGTAAVATLCAHIRASYNCKSVYLSVYEDNAPAIRIYERAGFVFNGKRDSKGEKIMVARD